MKLKVIIGAVAVLLLGATGIAVAVSGGEPKNVTRGTVASVHHMAHPAVVARRKRALAVDPRLVREMRVFRVARTSANAVSIPDRVRTLFNNDMGARAGANLALAREVATRDGAMDIVPGNGAVCQIGPGGIGCGPIANLSPVGMYLVSASAEDPPGTRHVSGIAPDTVIGIDAVMADGSKTPIPMTDNAYAAAIGGNWTGLDFETTDHGVVYQRVRPFPTPPLGERGSASHPQP